ncbi:hypothetical protein NMG60_11004004 [Bertholletia excelsa]
MANFRLLQFLLFVHFTFLLIQSSSQAHLPQPQNHVALFIFGDSLFDAGNNNYINTTTSFQANFEPYGETFFHHPTGRFSNGRLIPDFIAEHAKLPLLPPYKLPGNHQFTHGVNFASAGAGALSQTYAGMVIDLKTQLVYLKNVKKMLEQKLGEAEADKFLSRAVYLLSIGSNDYLFPFVTNMTSQIYSREEFVGMVIGNLTAVVEGIYKAGGRKFGFVNLTPLGCAPFMRLLNIANGGECVEEATAFAKLHNIALSKVLRRLERRLHGFKYSYFDFYTTSSEILNNPSKYGFKEVNSACCGSGPFRGLNSCGGKRGVMEYELCSNPREYVFFDFEHPTEMVYQQTAQLIWSGTSDVVSPYNLKTFFEQV